MVRLVVRRSILILVAALCAVGCLYPPVTQPPPDSQQEVVIPLPYDLAWDAVNAVVKENSFHVQAQDMTNGIIEAVGPRFTLHDADCGKIKSVAGAYIAEPEQNSSSVYNFLVRPRGPEASIVEVRATFNSSVSVPLHPSTDVDCVSHGIQESNLLRQCWSKRRRRIVRSTPSRVVRRRMQRRRRARLRRCRRPSLRPQLKKRKSHPQRPFRFTDIRLAGISNCRRLQRSRTALARA